MTQPLIPRPQTGDCSAYFERYTSLVPAEVEDILAFLREQYGKTRELLAGLTEEQGEHRYAPGKWTVKEVVGHLADTEQTFAFRALWIARGAPEPLPGFEQDDWVAAAGFGRFSLAFLSDQLRAVRATNLELFRGLTGEALARSGVVDGNPLAVSAVPWLLAGHDLHHVAVLRERYLS